MPRYYPQFSLPNPEVKSKYLLVVYSRPSPFMGSESTFALVDEFKISCAGAEGIPIRYEGLRNGEVVISFPGNQDYFLISRDDVEFVTAEEYKKRAAEAHAEMHGSSEGPGEATNKPSALIPSSPMTYL